jgi:hypothetical protein
MTDNFSLIAFRLNNRVLLANFTAAILYENQHRILCYMQQDHKNWCAILSTLFVESLFLNRHYAVVGISGLDTIIINKEIT